MTRLHLVNGFLGSGKTTAIVQAARISMAAGERVGVVTNDQGRYLVDTAFVRSEHIPAVQVSGGCFCCHYDELLDVLSELNDDARPDVIYAESVGSCADLIATVARPLLDQPQAGIECTSISVLADSRLLLRQLRGEAMPFSDDVLYIMDRQIDEAGVLVLNKVDLLTAEDLAELRGLAEKRLPGRLVLALSALENVAPWVETIESGQALGDALPARISYGRYGDGEASLAWVDRALQATPVDGRAAVIDLVGTIVAEVRAAAIPIAHLKFFGASATESVRLGFTATTGGAWEDAVPALAGTIQILLNARVQAGLAEAETCIDRAIAISGQRMGVAWQPVAGEALLQALPSVGLSQ